jgi:hypothetical protein
MILLRDPLLIAVALIVALIAYLYARGPAALSLFGQSVSLYPPENLTTLAYALAVLRIALFWRRHRTALEAMLGLPGRALLYWHALPVAASFLVPKRLSAFLWFVGPANAPDIPGKPPALPIYWSAFAEGFHPAVWAALLTLVLFALALSQYRRYPAGARAVFVLALTATAAVLIHPHHQGRFLASFIFAYWVGAGAGAALLLGWALPRRAARTRASVAAAGAAVLALALARAPPAPQAQEVAFRTPSDPSAYALIAPALPALDGARAVGFAATFGRSAFFPLVVSERCRCRLPVDAPWLEGLASREAARRAMLAYVAQTPADRLVVIDAPKSPYAAIPLWPYPVLAGILDAMQDQNRFVLLLSHDVPEQGARVTVWRRIDAPER